MPMSGRLLRPRNAATIDADAKAYLAAVAAADGQPLEASVQKAVSDFVKGLKADGLWAALKSSCILMGARTLSGALTPLVGTAPTNSGPFVSGDYDRKLGLKGGGAKLLNSNRAHNADPQNDCHAYVRMTQNSGNGGSNVLFGYQYSGDNSRSLTRFEQFPAFEFAVANNAGGGANASAAKALGGWGVSRSSATSYQWMYGNGPDTISANSTTPISNNIFIFGTSTATSPFIGFAGRLCFYSLGTGLSLAALNSRVGAMQTAIGAAI